MRLHSLKRLDNRLSLRLQSLSLRRCTRIPFSVFAHSGDSIVIIPCLFVLWWLGGFSWQSIAVLLAAGYVASVVVTSLLKYAFRRRRPPGTWGSIYRKTDPHSFPSGHASRTVTITMIVLARGWLLIGLALLLWSLLVGLSRIVLGVHYLYDVVAGYLLGLVIGVGIWILIALGIII